LHRSDGFWGRARHNMTNELRHIADLSRGETVKSRAFPCLVHAKTSQSRRRREKKLTGMSRACSGRHGEVSVMEYKLYRSKRVQTTCPESLPKLIQTDHPDSLLSCHGKPAPSLFLHAQQVPQEVPDICLHCHLAASFVLHPGFSVVSCLHAYRQE